MRGQKGRLRQRWEDNIRMDLQEIVVMMWTSGSKYELEVGSCEQTCPNHLHSSIKDGMKALPVLPSRLLAHKAGLSPRS